MKTKYPDLWAQFDYLDPMLKLGLIIREAEAQTGQSINDMPAKPRQPMSPAQQALWKAEYDKLPIAKAKWKLPLPPVTI